MIQYCFCYQDLQTKKSMKNIILTFVTVLLFSMVQNLSAQKPKRDMDPQKMSEKQTQMLKEDVGLTAEQEPKVAAINLKYAKLTDEARKNNADKVAMREKMQTLRKEKREELKKVLTDAQFKKMVEIEKTRMQNKPGNGGAGE